MEFIPVHFEKQQFLTLGAVTVAIAKMQILHDLRLLYLHICLTHARAFQASQNEALSASSVRIDQNLVQRVSGVPIPGAFGRACSFSTNHLLTLGENSYTAC